MKLTVLVPVLAGVSYIAFGAGMAAAAYLEPCPAPLPGLGVTLLGQAAAGALGWKLFRKRRPAK